MKHIAIGYHFVRDQVSKGLLRVSHALTKVQLADALTKLLSSFHFSILRSKIGILDGTTILRGRDKETPSNHMHPASNHESQNQPP